MTRILLFAMGMEIFLSGCTTELNVSRASKEYDPDSPPIGWEYSLPLVQYDIEVTYVVPPCEKINDGEIELGTTAKATASFVRDPGETYYIDYRSLSAPTKTSLVQMEKYPNGMLKSIGAGAQDRVAPAIVATVNTVVKLVATAAAAVASASDSAGDTKGKICKEGVEGAQKKASVLRGQLADLTVHLTGETERLQGLSTIASSVSTGTNAKFQDALRNAVAGVVTRRSEVNRAAEMYSVELRKFSTVKKLRFAPSAEGIKTEHQLTIEELKEWFYSPTKASERVVFRLVGRDATAPDGKVPCPREKSPGLVCDVAKSKEIELAKAIRYRTPAIGRLVLCKDNECASEAELEASEVLWEGPIPQLGRIVLIPFVNGAFEDNSLTATFGEDGSLHTASYSDKAATAEAVIATAAQVAELLPQAVQTFTLAGPQTEAAEILAKASVLEAKAKLRDAEDALTPTTIDANEEKRALFAADSALKDAERANIAATYALEQARLDPLKAK